MIVTILIVLVVGSWAVFLPLIRNWKRLGGDVTVAQRELDGYRQTIKTEPEWRGEYDKLRAQLGAKIESFEQTSDVLKKVEEVGAQAGVVISQRRELPKTDRGVYRELPVQCRVEATTESLVKFLYALRTGSGFVSVEQMQVVTQGNNSSVLRCDFVIHALAGKSEKTKS
mgnify:FL=1